MKEKTESVGRLAMRHEGNMWNAYYALTNTMADANLLGSIAMGAIENNRERKQAFMEMMRDIAADIIEDKTGVRPTWQDLQTAPEHERAGHG